MKEKAVHPLLTAGAGEGRPRGSQSRRDCRGERTSLLLCHNGMTSLFMSLMKRTSLDAFLVVKGFTPCISAFPRLFN